MKKIKFAILLSLILLCFSSLYHPVFEEFRLYKHEGEKVALYFSQVLEKENNAYLVATEYGNETVICELELSIEETVSFYGAVRDGKLIAEKVHSHQNPSIPYYLSAVGLVLLLFSLRKNA
jgi:hypothetical protein